MRIYNETNSTKSKNAKITIDNSITREMQEGILVYIGIKKQEKLESIDKAVSKLLKLRFF